MGLFDTHNDYRVIVDTNFKAIDHGLKGFVAEMKAQVATCFVAIVSILHTHAHARTHAHTRAHTQEVWDDVVVVALSDFGRKLSPNGLGTDHAWGGMCTYRVMHALAACLVQPSRNTLIQLLVCIHIYWGECVLFANAKTVLLTT